MLLAVFILVFLMCWLMPSVLWRCWLGGRKGIRPVKNWVVGCWCGICLEQGADLHMAQLMPLPLTVSCFSKIQIGFTFLVPAHLGSSGKRAVKRVWCADLSKNKRWNKIVQCYIYFISAFTMLCKWLKWSGKNCQTAEGGSGHSDSLQQ